ncbi:DUF7373 family lipoprotein [Nocardia cyriacigeorgica]|uniref:DUF7373 family lipoprotein n=1 Tax=Nocardia cyriacigeorgica TaxID=135487 RepID=UPI003D7B1273
MLTVGIGGCGADEAESTAPATVPDPVVDLTQLDTGSFPTEPRELGKPASLDHARMVEAQRLGNYLPLPAATDPMFIHNDGMWVNAFIDPKPLEKIIVTERFPEAAPDFIGGFLTTAGSERDNEGIDILTAALLFPTEESAERAATELERVDFEYNKANQRVEIPKYPEAHAHWEPGGSQSIGSWYAVGPVVIYSWVYDYKLSYVERHDLAGLQGLVEKNLDAVVPAISKFEPTPPDKLMEIDADPEGILGRTLPGTTSEGTQNSPGTHTGIASVHFAIEMGERRRLVDENGIDGYAFDGSELYRAKDVASARTVGARLTELSRKYRSADPPRTLPQATCIEYIGREMLAFRFYCSVSHGRYAARTWSSQLLDAQQRISAQYALLVNAE